LKPDYVHDTKIQAPKYGSTFTPCPGYDLHVLNENNQPVERGQLGGLAVKLPLPPGCLLTLYKADDRYVKTYMSTRPGYYDTGKYRSVVNNVFT
jgi:propionyl-CoA synthetase